MKADDIKRTLLNARLCRTNEARATTLLVGIHELLTAIAYQLGAIDEDDEEDEE